MTHDQQPGMPRDGSALRQKPARWLRPVLWILAPLIGAVVVVRYLSRCGKAPGAVLKTSPLPADRLSSGDGDGIPSPGFVAVPRPAPLHSIELRRPDGRIEHPGVRRETTDARLRPVLIVALCGACFGGLLGWSVWKYFVWRVNVNVGQRYPLMPEPAELPSGPRLEQLDHLAAGRDAHARLEAQKQQLESYGPTGEKGFVHVPIEQAIERLADQFPIRKPSRDAGDSASVKSRGLVNAGESNSGRRFQGASDERRQK
jgi:hypothetical protein